MQFKTLFVALAAAGSAMAGSPLESGNWKEYTPGHSDQTCAGGNISGNTFSIPKSPQGGSSGGACSNGHLRAERRFDNYNSGVRQFGGTVKINSGSGNRVSLKQTFHDGSGPFFIMAVDNGRLYSVEDGKTIADGVAHVGSSVRINTVHNMGNKQFRVYVNGEQKYSTTSDDGNFYDKIGVYTTNSGSGDLSVTWSDVQFWQK